MSVVINSYQSGRPSKVDVATVMKHLPNSREHAADLERGASRISDRSSLPRQGHNGATWRSKNFEKVELGGREGRARRFFARLNSVSSASFASSLPYLSFAPTASVSPSRR